MLTNDNQANLESNIISIKRQGKDNY